MTETKEIRMEHGNARKKYEAPVCQPLPAGQAAFVEGGFVSITQAASDLLTKSAKQQISRKKGEECYGKS